MTKTFSSTKQDAVNYMALPDNNEVDVFIYLNEQEKQDEDGLTYYEYDFNQFRVNQTQYPKELITANPDKFLSFEPVAPLTIEERLSLQEEAMQDLTMMMLGGI